MIRWLLGALIASGAALDVRSQELLEALGERLTYTAADGEAWARLSAMGDVTAYAPDRPAPGLLFTDDATFVAPRLILSLDAGAGDRFSAHAQLRADRGFDPGLERRGDVRFDEYYLQAQMLDDWRVQVRVGKFATVFGGWVERHQVWDNPLITAPALYEDMVTVTDQAAPAGLDAFAARRDMPENKAGWVPIVWGPSYATGASISAGTGALDFFVEVKNAALSSRPTAWDAVRDGFETRPTVTGRIAFHPSAVWTLGASFSQGPYLREDARPTLPPGTRLNDFDQTTAGLDLTYELHRLQIWSELVRARFEVPRVGEVEATSGFVELRHKVAPQFWLAGRLNRSWFDDTPGLDRPWDRNLTRLDLALGYRYSSHIQAKLEYSHGDQAGRNTMGKRLVAAQLALWF
jgi:hypothetical protein